MDATPTSIDRREAIRRVSLLLGGAGLVGGSTLLAACEAPDRPEPGRYEAVGDFTADDVVLLDEIAETMLPETDTPGAKAAGVGPFVALMVTDTYELDEQDTFRAGLATVDTATMESHGIDFMRSSAEQRLALVESLDEEQFDHEEARSGGAPKHWFRMMKELTLAGYFTSEIGCTVARRYVEAPGRWEPCVPYVDGETSWAEHA